MSIFDDNTSQGASIKNRHYLEELDTVREPRERCRFLQQASLRLKNQKKEEAPLEAGVKALKDATLTSAQGNIRAGGRFRHCNS